jgi:hypothetical protein
MRRRPRDQPNSYPSKDGREKRGNRNRFLLMHQGTPLEIPAMHQAGPAIFAIDEAKNECHGTNSVVDCMTKIAPVCFVRISLGTKIDFVGPEIGFRRRLSIGG